MNLNAEELVGLSKENPVKHDKPDVKSKDIAPLSNSSSLFVSNYHLSHQYIRKSIENLYDVIEETTRERDEMAKKNQDIQNQISIIKEQLKEKIKAIHVLERDKFQELSRLQTQLQHVQNEKVKCSLSYLKIR
jgi:septation ring formation regulator EzrA